MTASRTLTACLLLALTGCPSDATEADTDPATATPATEIDTTPDGNTYAVLVRGDLFTTDVAEAKTLHDQVAGGGQTTAEDMGDLAHDALLNTVDGSFMALDRWDNLPGMNAVYSDPTFVSAFGSLFSGMPSQEVFVAQPTWANWGDYDAGDAGDPYFFVVVRGTLAESDPAMAQAAHDAVAGGGQADAMAAGDLAHLVHTGLEDPQEFFAIDIWTDGVAMEAFYGDPHFAAAFASLFDGPPDVQIYASTDWHTW